MVAEDTAFADRSLAFTLARAQYAVRLSIRDEMQRLDINIDQYFALAALGAKYMSVTEIDELGRIYDRSFDQACALELERRALVDFATANGDSKLQLTAAGRQLMWQLLAISKDAETTLLGQFEEWEAQWLKAALQRIGNTRPTVVPDDGST